MKLKIDSDGTRHGTHVFTERGEALEGVVAVKWEIDAKIGKSVATIVIHDVPAVLYGEAITIGKDKHGLEL